MADEFVLTGVTSGAPTLTLEHGPRELAGFPTAFHGLAWSSVRWLRRGPTWSLIEPAGIAGSFGKFMGKRSRILQMQGFIWVRGYARTVAYTHYDTHLLEIESLQAGKYEFNITGPRAFPSVVCINHPTETLGSGQGLRLRFLLEFLSLLG